MLDANALAQKQRSELGNDFEDAVTTVLNAFIPDDGLVAVKGKSSNLSSLLGDAARDLVNFVRLPVKRRCTQAQIEDYPDSDIFVLRVPQFDTQFYRLVAIVSCKNSLRERYLQSCFWGAALRASASIKYLFVTADNDVYHGGPSELGRSCAQPRQARRLLECYTDRIYLIKPYAGPRASQLAADIERKKQMLARGREQFNNSIIFDDPSQARHTEYCPLVRPFDAIFADLRYWNADIPS